MRRFNSIVRGPSLLLIFCLMLGLVALKSGSNPAAVTNVNAVDAGPEQIETDGTVADETVEGPSQVAPDASEPGAVIKGPTGVAPPAAGAKCTRAGNGGATDKGVTAGKIKLASTVVQSGVGASFLGASPIAIKAVVARVNSAGGICGRLLDIKLVDDGWDASRGLGFIRNFIDEGVFAMPVVPSSEGLTAAIEAGDITKSKMPVVGTDGMLLQQYQNPHVWPVATATVSTMRIMAKYAYDKGARKFGLVYDKFYRFGKEGADAFKDYVSKLPGANVTAFVGILPGQPNYSSEIESFNGSCNSSCDFVGMLLEPSTATQWVAGRPQFGKHVTSGSQTLFNERFAQSCGEPCNGMIVWTGYNPPIGPLASQTDVEQYVNDVRNVSPTVDVTNQFLEGSYLGMSVFVEALKKVGPTLTRDRLRAVMDSLDYTNGIASGLSWRPGKHNANLNAHGFAIVIAQGSFAGFRNAQTGFIADPG